MTASDYLKLQADLLIAAESLRRLGPALGDMRIMVDEIAASGQLLDHHRMPVQVNTERMRIMIRAAREFNRLAGVQCVQRKDVQSADGQAQPEQRERLRA